MGVSPALKYKKKKEKDQVWPFNGGMGECFDQWREGDIGGVAFEILWEGHCPRGKSVVVCYVGWGGVGWGGWWVG